MSKVNKLSDKWKLVLDTEQINRGLDNISKKMNRDYEGKNVAVIGILTGAIYFTVDLSRKLSFAHTIDYMRISNYKNERTISEKFRCEEMGQSFDLFKELSDKHVIIMDELYDSGKTIADAVKYISTYSPLSIKTCVMFHKYKSSHYPLPDYVGISKLPDVWYVGYGLDDKGYLRNLNALYALPKLPGDNVTSDDNIFNDDDLYKSILSRIEI